MSCVFHDAGVRGRHRKRDARTTGRCIPEDISHIGIVELSLTFSRRSAVDGSLCRCMMPLSLSPEPGPWYTRALLRLERTMNSLCH